MACYSILAYLAKVHTLLFVEETEKLHGIRKRRKQGPGIQCSVVTHLAFWGENSRILVEGEMVTEK